MERSKGSRLKGWIESPNALRQRLGQLSGCAFTETESSKIIIAKLGLLRQRRRLSGAGMTGQDGTGLEPDRRDRSLWRVVVLLGELTTECLNKRIRYLFATSI
jgi:hypothetical protein